MEIRGQLTKYNPKDVYFLKSKWREWVEKREFRKFEEEEQKPNILTVYNIFDASKIVSIENARNGFSAVRTKHSSEYDIVIILKIENERVEIMTYYKESTQRRLQNLKE